MVDEVELINDARADLRRFDLAQFEGVCVDDVFGLDRRHALPEHPRSAVMILETLGALTNFMTVDLLGVVPEHILVRQCRAAAAERIREVAGSALGYRLLA